MGSRLRLHWCCAQFHWPRHLQNHIRNHGSSVLPRCSLPGLLFLRKEEDGIENRYPLLWITNRSEWTSYPRAVSLNMQNAFGGLFALAILKLEGAHGIRGWRWLFIVEGIMTVGFAIIFATFIPNTPQKIRWLTPLEKQQLLYRLEVDRGTKDAGDELSVWQGLKLAVLDIKTWLLCSILQVRSAAASWILSDQR